MILKWVMRVCVIIFVFLYTSNVFAQRPELVVYTPTSFQHCEMSSFLKEQFEKRCQVRLRYVDCGAGVSLLNRVILEGCSSSADVMIGLDAVLGKRAAQAGLFEPISGVSFNHLPLPFQSNTFIPYSCNYLAFVYNSKVIHPPCVTSMEFLKNPPGELILQDPRFSVVGLVFQKWMQQLFTGRFTQVWQGLQTKTFKLARGWGESLIFFQRGEAPFMLSYLTMPLYEATVNQNPHIRSLFFTDGHPLVVETATLLKTSKNRELGKKFILFLLSKEIQKNMLKKNWMLPVRQEELSLVKQTMIKIPRTVLLPLD